MHSSSPYASYFFVSDAVHGAARHTRDALAVASVRLESADSLVGSPDARIGTGRYDLRIEDRARSCRGVHQDVRVNHAGVVTRGARMVESCQPLLMAEVVRRGRRIARLPLAAGDLADCWSVASATTGWVDVYADSVVITAKVVTLRASHPIPDTLTGHVDSLVMALMRGEVWPHMIRQSVGIPVGASLRPGQSWTGLVR